MLLVDGLAAGGLVDQGLDPVGEWVAHVQVEEGVSAGGLDRLGFVPVFGLLLPGDDGLP